MGMHAKTNHIFDVEAVLEEVDRSNRRLLDSDLPPCTGAFRKQHLLPCAHDPKQAYEANYPMPKSMVHPRYWIEGHTPITTTWQPTDLYQTPTTPLELPIDLQTLFYGVMNVRERLAGEAGRR